MSIRIKIREVAKQRGMGQSRIARKVDMDLSVVQRIYRDPSMNITLATLEKLCRALDCTPNDLLEFDPPLVSE
ncbi:MAG TPA: helix-turn-helix transcriptional regulator [Ktedonobacteraceae bacterium]|nr:helix-turn-helix transcriptional regulator [Ktedonobacteraceae bacterium]